MITVCCLVFCWNVSTFLDKIVESIVQLYWLNFRQRFRDLRRRGLVNSNFILCINLSMSHLLLAKIKKNIK